MVSKRRIISLGRFLTKLLRHSPELAGLSMDKNGWVEVDELLVKTINNPKPMDLSELLEVVRCDDKGRFSIKEMDGRRFIRCEQGHSAKLDVDLGYECVVPPAKLYHGCAVSSLEVIVGEGLKPMERQYVHLTECIETAIGVGGRHGVPALLTVDAIIMHQSGYFFHLSDNGVWLTKEVPVEFITFDD